MSGLLLVIDVCVEVSLKGVLLHVCVGIDMSKALVSELSLSLLEEFD